MNNATTIETVQGRIARWAISEPLVLRVWIFGSRVRGDNRPDSDLDVAIELDAMDESGGLATWMLRTSHWAAELQALAPWKIHLEQYAGNGTPMIAHALTHSSRLIYEKSYAPDVRGDERA